MRQRRFLIALRGLMVLMLFGGIAYAAAREGVLYSFNGTSGSSPIAGLIFDAVGDMYGTTDQGGTYGCGTAFELMPTAGGGWTEVTLHTFNKDGMDGCGPQGGLTFDAVGNLYGTTTYGGAYNYGTVFELTPSGSGNWTEIILHSFNKDGKDGFSPQAGLTFDDKGNLYGTTGNGGSYYLGAVFELTPAGDGNWTEVTVYCFRNDPDGSYPLAGVIFQAGDLYGTTVYGGFYGYGTVFELRPSGNGGWTERILRSFNWNGRDGFFPYAGVVFDTAGNLYGVTSNGGAYGCGAVFELRALAAGGWADQVLHRFRDSQQDGCAPAASVVFDGGSLYGTTVNGGTYGAGTVFGLRRKMSGVWEEGVLHSFGAGGDGQDPNGLTIDAGGDLIGTTSQGGTYGAGTAFAVGR